MPTIVKVSIVQANILKWLWMYPGIFIHWFDLFENHVNWTAQWDGEDSRRQMVSFAGHGYAGLVGLTTEPRQPNPDGGTPRLPFASFRALLSKGFIRSHWTLSAEEHPRGYLYQLSQSGKAVVVGASK